MSLKNIIKEIERADTEQVSDRRELFKGFGAKVAMASLPLAVGTLLAKKASGKTTADAVINTLNYVLSISYLQYNFFHTATSVGSLISDNPGTNLPAANDMPGFKTIADNELAHIRFLNEAVTSLGGVPYTPRFYDANALNPYYVPTAYDFTMKGTYGNVFTQYPVFLIIAQAMLDTSVRAIKSHVLLVTGNTKVMTQLLQIHSVEARHAAYTRTVRRYNVTGAEERPAPWITNDIAPLTALHNNYKGEDVMIQIGGVIIDELPNKYTNNGMTPKISATAAFDEPIDVALANKFYEGFNVS